jgi:hypothetical protein
MCGAGERPHNISFQIRRVRFMACLELDLFYISKTTTNYQLPPQN